MLQPARQDGASLDRRAQGRNNLERDGAIWRYVFGRPAGPVRSNVRRQDTVEGKMGNRHKAMSPCECSRPPCPQGRVSGARRHGLTA